MNPDQPIERSLLPYPSSPGTDASPLSRRAFLSRTVLATGAMAVGGLIAARGQDEAPPTTTKGTRFVFLTDVHLMMDDAMDSARGLAACLDAVEALQPRPDFILCGGDLTHESPALTFDLGEKLIDRFLQIWNDHTKLPTHYTFGNHDFVGTKNPLVPRDDPRFGKGLWRQKLGLEHSFYGFDTGGWRLIVLDDVGLNPDGTYTGEFSDEQLVFLKGELAAASNRPVAICGHIPPMSVFPTVAGFAKLVGAKIETAGSLVATNTKAMLDEVKEAHSNLRLVLAGHLHHYEQIELDGIRYLNSGAVCGNWWKGAQLGCPEGFLVVDTQPDGRFSTEYKPYGWQAKA